MSRGVDTERAVRRLDYAIVCCSFTGFLLALMRHPFASAFFMAAVIAGILVRSGVKRS